MTQYGQTTKPLAKFQCAKCSFWHNHYTGCPQCWPFICRSCGTALQTKESPCDCTKAMMPTRVVVGAYEAEDQYRSGAFI